MDQLNGQRNEGVPRSFYWQLKMYKPICYSGTGVPTFLLLRENPFSSSLPCIVIINLLIIFVIVMQWVESGGSHQEEEGGILRSVNVLVIIMIDVFYLLTVTLNPGVVGQQDLEEGEAMSFCVRCNRKVSMEMKHCIECSTCICDLDHHCGFFGKCIGGRQRFAFYGFITFMFVGFICLLGSLSFLFTVV